MVVESIFALAVVADVSIATPLRACADVFGIRDFSISSFRESIRFWLVAHTSGQRPDTFALDRAQLVPAALHVPPRPSVGRDNIEHERARACAAITCPFGRLWSRSGHLADTVTVADEAGKSLFLEPNSRARGPRSLPCLRDEQL